MDPVSAIAVVGACAPERRSYARRLADATDRMLIPSARLERSPDPALEAASLAPWSDRPNGTVIEFPSTAAITEIIGVLGDPLEAIALDAVVCVVDAGHLLDDLAADDFLVSERDELGRPLDYVARASLTVAQLEFASTIVLTAWEALPTPQLSTVAALVSALSPGARLRLDHDGAPTPAERRYAPEQARAGWIDVLNGAADPHMTDPRVGAFRYEQLRPFHPQRLSDLLTTRFESGDLGRIVRSCGFCRLATRAHAVLHWDHVGRTIAFHLAPDDAHDAEDGMRDESETLSIGQDLAFIGLDLDRPALIAALDRAALTDAEFSAGPAEWQHYPDPFPMWDASVDSNGDAR